MIVGWFLSYLASQRTIHQFSAGGGIVRWHRSRLSYKTLQAPRFLQKNAKLFGSTRCFTVCTEVQTVHNKYSHSHTQKKRLKKYSTDHCWEGWIPTTNCFHRHHQTFASIFFAPDVLVRVFFSLKHTLEVNEYILKKKAWIAGSGIYHLLLLPKFTKLEQELAFTVADGVKDAQLWDVEMFIS